MVMINDTPTLWQAQFDNLPDMAHWLRETPRKWDQKTSESNSDPEWYMNASYSRTLELMERGWPDGVKDVSDKLGSLPPRERTRGKDRFNIAGHMPDVPRFLGGSPMHMIDRGATFGKKPTVVLYVTVGGSSSISATQFKNHGAALVAAIDRIENSGRRVEVNAIWCMVEGLKRATVVWNVKRAEDPCDLSSLAFSLGHAAAPRRLGFAAVERSPRHFESYSYGRPYVPPREELLGADDTAVVMAGMTTNVSACRTMEDAIRFVAENINKATGEELVSVEL